MSDFFDEHVDEDGDLDDFLRQSISEHTVFLVDAGAKMQHPAGVTGLEGYSESDTFLVVALKIVRELMKQHIISSPKDQMSVVFYDAATEKNDASFPTVNIALPLEETTAARIKEVEALSEKFEEKIGWVDSDEGDGVRDGLWASTHILQAKETKADKRVIIFTNQDHPCGKSSDTASRQILSRAEALHEAKIEVELFNLTPDNSDFSMDFWGKIVKNPEDELGSQTWTADPLRLQDLEMNVRRKRYKKRALASLPWSIGPDFHFAVKLFALIHKATASKSIPIDLRTNDVLTATGVYIDNDTGSVVEKIDKFSFPKDEKQAPRFPKVIVTTEERKALKMLRPPGISLIGFKPLTCLQSWHQLQPAIFAYPDNRSQPGSATAFIALHDRLLKKQVFALCAIVRNKAAEPRLIAAIAQQEEVDEHGTQVTAPGINLVWLPFKDDLRHPESDKSFLGAPSESKASDNQILAAERMLAQLEIPEFAPGCLPNPHLQRHYQVVEALALGEDPQEMKTEDDYTLPEPFQASALNAIAAFRAAVYGQGRNDPLASVRKRKAEQDATLELDAKELVKKGSLSKLTVKVLMELCRKERLATTGRKQELIDRLTQHLK